MKREFSGYEGRRRSVAALLLALAAYSVAGTALAQTAKKAKPEPGPDPIAEIEKLRAEFEQKLKEQETAAQSREEALKKEQAAVVEAAGTRRTSVWPRTATSDRRKSCACRKLWMSPPRAKMRARRTRHPQ